MLKLLFAATILIGSTASAGEIVFRSPTSGTLTAIADPAPTQPEPDQPAFGIRYETISVAVGTSISFTPIGDTGGYTFAALNPLPPGLALDNATGKIVGVAAITGNHNIAVRATKGDFSADLVLSIMIS